MSKPIVMVQPDTAPLTSATPIEILPTGELELAPDAPPLTRITAGDLVDQATKGFRDTVFDPKRREEFTRHQSALDTIADASLGASDSLPEVAQPPSADKVAGAAESVIKHKAMLRENSLVAYEQVPWSTFEADVAHLAQVTAESERLQARAENLEILQAHLRQRVNAYLQAVWKLASSSIDGHRGLEVSLKPLTELFTAPAQQGVETKRTVQRAVAKALKANAAKPVIETAASDKPAPPSPAK